MRHGDLVKLVRVLGMLGSDHAGERASAALAAHRLVKASGDSWAALLSPFKVPRPAPRGRGVFVDIFHDPARAAASRIRQLRRENDELRNEVRRLKRWLDARNAAARRATRLKDPGGLH